MPETKSFILTAYLRSAAALRYRKLRHAKDNFMRYLMVVGGVGAIVAIVLIAFYLLWVVIPLFRPASIELLSQYPVPGGGTSETIYYATEEQREIGLRISADGTAIFFRTSDGGLVESADLLSGTNGKITSFAAGDPSQRVLAFGLDDGDAFVVRHNYTTTFPDNKRLITPVLDYPLGNNGLRVDPDGQPLKRLAVQSNEQESTIAAITEDSRLLLLNLTGEESFLTGETTQVEIRASIPGIENVVRMALDVEQRELYLADTQGFIQYYNISDKATPRLVQKVKAVSEGASITELKFLSGGISILVGDSYGRIVQWFPVRDANNNFTLERIRSFQSGHAPISAIAPEFSRKGMLAIDIEGRFTIYHATAHRTVTNEKLDNPDIKLLAVSPRADSALIESRGIVQFWNIHNEHPEVSWHSIWGKVWYENRGQPEYIWQSSSASSDFEPKFSLTPLAFGTFKAAVFAMIFAIPLSIMGAVYTAYFMTPRMRNMVKPTIEIMAALPTVILGFLAGLWFAPIVENFLPGVFLILLLLPLAIVFAAWSWDRIPEKIRAGVPGGWEAALLIPVVLLTGMLALAASKPVELWLFGGNLPLWLTTELGIHYEQRNSLVVGIAIGFAVIPTIFSISEDAIFGVPPHLTTGSLALGATPWQTMMRVILLTASPGIFSAVMIGLGRAVGETMIVVMATGNTAIMDLNIFEGFRALSANIAVEMPESEVDSTHYRILFLAGLVLFIATFIFNTVAEVVRQRLRVKYSNL
jgi:phosphate transport system permease protein